MIITAQRVASIHYKLTNDDAEVLDSSAGQEPLSYLHGAQNLVPGLEQELEGKSTGDKLSVTVPPETGYGEKNPDLIQELPMSMFSGVDKVEVGMEFHAKTQNGAQVVEVIEVENDTVTIDANHPLAGVQLNFEVEVMDVREATAEELEHGHAHSAGGAHTNDH